MQHIFSFNEVNRSQTKQDRPIKDSFVTVGSFDGVHLGHKAILSPMVEQAHSSDASVVVVTFHPHPVVVLRGNNGPLYLTSPEERARLLGEIGVDLVITLTFDRVLASLTAEQFVKQLVTSLGMRKLWAGNDFTLGRDRQGDIETLKRIGDRLGYDVETINLVDSAGRISSSRIRDLLRDGNTVEAARLLGRPYMMGGPVVHGDGRGRSLGFPTANVQYWPGKIVPAFGVYATWTLIGGRRLPSVTSVGVRPTFDNPPAEPRVEVFIIDFDDDLYDQTLRIEFLDFLRPELRFDSVQMLIDQMNIDTQNAREVLANAS